MNVIFILIIIALVMASSFLAAFLYACINGQFSDCETPAQRILFDEEFTKNTNLNNKNGVINEPK
jgi:cbb3-type cytochrome oxidase maturation protein